MTVRRLGDITIARIVEREEPAFAVAGLLPDATPETLAPYRHWLEPKALDPASGLLILPIQSYLVRTRHHNILIDGCMGEDKTCRWQLAWHQLKGLRFLSDLAALGLAPEDIDFVMCTHLHGDHVGWNTRLVNGRWVPTFPNARYVISRRELAHWEDYNKTASVEAYEECIDESVLPVVAAGQALLVNEDHAVDDEVWLEPLPGHTPGHFGVRLLSNGSSAIMIGDPVLGRQVRRRFLESHAETDHLVLTAHFPSPSIGYIRRHANAFGFDYVK
jgi:glyoxylase-like metal-dependent hydrolase (beta-lactamase superfamily II)